MSECTPTAVHREAFDILCDKLLGSGMSRKVFSSLVLPDCVVKCEEYAAVFQNVMEWETWQRVKDTPASRWFAECKWISPNGTVLVMERTQPARDGDFPDKMPVFLCDFKRANYGLVSAGPRRKGKKGETFLVCHDYGTNLAIEHGIYNHRTRKAEWFVD